MNFTADPEIGRFISQDSYRGELNDPGQWHLYTYCANNPINYVDPSGHAQYKWNKKVYERCYKKYWYQTGNKIVKKKNTEVKRAHWRIGHTAKYLIPYWKLSSEEQELCQKYKNGINRNNELLDDIYFTMLYYGISITMTVILTLIKATEPAWESYGITVEQAAEFEAMSDEWHARHAKVKKRYNKIKKYGTKY